MRMFISVLLLTVVSIMADDSRFNIINITM